MSFSLPNPTTPMNGQPGDATPILQNEVALANAIASFDGSQIQSKSVTETALANAINPRLRHSETLANFVFTGCIWTTVSGLNGTMTGGTVYVNGYRTIVAGIASNTFTVFSDTYVDIDYLGNVTYNAVSNGAGAPALAVNNIRVAKVVTGGAISSIAQSGDDGIGNLVYPLGAISTSKIHNHYKFSVYKTTGSTFGTSFTQIAFSSKEYDTGSNYDAVTNHNFTAPIAGFYFFTAHVEVNTWATSTDAYISLFKNASEVKRGSRISAPSSGNGGLTVSASIQLAANDTIDVRGGSTSHSVATGGGQTVDYFMGWLISGD